MSDDKKVYAGYGKIENDEEIIEAVVMSGDPNTFTGKYLEITSDTGEGSFADVVMKLKKEFQNGD